MKSRLMSVLLLACALAPLACKSTDDGAMVMESNVRVHLGMLELDFRAVFRDAELVNEGPDWKTYRATVEKFSMWGVRGGGFVASARPHETDFVFRGGRLVEYRSVH